MKKKSDPKSAIPLRTPTHGNGRLRVGNPGNKGGTGRPPSELRALAREGVGKALPRIEHIAVNPEGLSRESDQIAAFAALSKLGLPAQMEVGENPDNPILTTEERKARLKALGL